MRLTPSLRALPVLSVAALAAALILPPAAHACSMCRCGDPTFNALGSDVYGANNFRLAVDAERFDKEQGLFGEEEAGTEEMVEDRWTASLAYTLADRAVLVARLPWSSREMTSHTADADKHSESLSSTSRGLADPEVYGLVRLWSSEFGPNLGRRAWISALGGVKTDWGENDLQEDGERMDEHAQPGTGSTDVFGGLSGLYLITPASSVFGSFQLRRTGSNDFGYRYGNTVLANFAYERKFTPTLDGILEINYRNAGRDRIDDSGLLDPNTGGSVYYLSPKLGFDLGHGVVARAAAQIPVQKSLNGEQKEKAVVHLGLTVVC
jgi:hypothetical protein